MARDPAIASGTNGRLKRLQALLRLRVYAGWALFWVLAIAGPYIVITAFEWPWWSIALGCVAIALAAGRTLSCIAKWTMSAQKARRRWLLSLAATCERPPILLLRSFLSPTNVEPEAAISLFGSAPIKESGGPRSNLLRVASHVRKYGPVVAIGAVKRGTARNLALDVLAFEPSDDDWFEVFEILSAASRAIVLLPGETESVGREYASLKLRDLVAKLVIVMPPHRRYIARWPVKLGLVDDGRDEIQKGWERAQSHFSALGVSLPPYDPGGLAFTIGGDGRMKDSIRLNGSLMPLERGLDGLLHAGSATTESLRIAMRRLRPFGIADILAEMT